MTKQRSRKTNLSGWQSQVSRTAAIFISNSLILYVTCKIFPFFEYFSHKNPNFPYLVVTLMYAPSPGNVKQKLQIELKWSSSYAKLLASIISAFWHRSDIVETSLKHHLLEKWLQYIWLLVHEENLYLANSPSKALFKMLHIYSSPHPEISLSILDIMYI